MLNPDFKDMLSALSVAAADYLIVGAYAVAAHGYPRATGDLDVWVRPTSDNATKVWDASGRPKDIAEVHTLESGEKEDTP